MDALSAEQVSAAVGAAEVNLFQNHLAKNPPNKNHWPTTNFWQRAAQTVTSEATDNGVAINVNQVGVAQRYYGGDIYPRDHLFLTIPARSAAYGRTAGDFSNLTVTYGRNGAFALVESLPGKISAGKKGAQAAEADDAGGGALFWLVRSVRQDPDPTVLPNESEIAQAAKAAIASLLKSNGRTGN